MKNIFFYIVALLPIGLNAQTIDRSKAPASDKAPLIQIPQATHFTLANGLQIYVVKNTKLPRVSATLSIDIDGTLEGDKAGVADITGQLLKRGTTTKSKIVLDESVEFLGGALNTSSTAVSVSSLKNNFPKLFELMAEVVLHPALSADELEKVRKQTLSGIESNKDEPGAISKNVLQKLVYGASHPYGEITNAKTVNNIKIEDVKNCYASTWMPNIAYLVFVGDIDPTQAKLIAEKSFGNWKKGTAPNVNFPAVPKPSKTYIAVVDRPASVQTNVIVANSLNLKKGDPMDIPANVMNNILGGGFSGRLFANLREKHGFTYGAYSSLSSNPRVGIFSAESAVRNEKTDSAIQEILFEINNIQKEKVPVDELSRMKNYLAGGFARSLENPSTIASFALNTAKYHLPSDYYQNYLKNLSLINSDDVQKAANTLLQPNGETIILVGNAKQIAKGLDKYGEVKYFDIEGNEVAPPSVSAIDASMTPESIINKSISALGGADKIKSIADITMKGKVTVMNNALDVVVKMKAPKNMVQVISMGAMTLSKQSVIDGNYEVVAQGQSAPLNDEMKESLDDGANLVPEMTFLSKGYTFKLIGIEKVNDKEAYDIEVTTTSGKKTHRFYDKNSFLLVKTSKTQEVPGRGPVTTGQLYNNYKAFGGVLIAQEQVLDMGVMKMNMQFTDITVNTGMTIDDMKK
jgi:predicted Zn-dependent peptidase